VDRQQQAPDEKKQAQADAAERQAIQQALQKKNPAADQRTPVALHESNAQREKREAVEALLQRVPDDPGGLLRRKFALEYARRQQEDQK
jgi:Ca-activated chloride channel family protein